MQFRRLDATFGKLAHTALSFSEGLNIIEAPNESGKSTLLAFLRAMLYGLPTRERGTLADKNRYAPWSLAPMQGTLELSCALGDITLQRGTARANSPMGRFSAVYTGSGETVDGLSAAGCGEALLGVPCEVYERSAFIRQSSLSVDGSAELERRIAALITTGEEGGSYTEAAAVLKKQLNARKYNRSGRIPALEAEISALERTQEELAALAARRAEAEDTLRALDTEQAQLESQLRAHDLCDARDARRAVTEAERRWQSAEAEAERLRRAMTADAAPSREALAQARAKLDALAALRSEADGALAQKTGAEEALAAFDAAPAKRPRSLLPLAFIALAAFFCCLLLPQFSGAAALIGRALTGAAAIVLFALDALRRSKARAAHAARRETLVQAVRDAQSAAAAQQRLLDSAERELLALLPAAAGTQTETYLRAALARHDALDACVHEAQSARIRYEALAARDIPPAAGADETAERPARTRAELQAALGALQERRREAQSARDYTEGRSRAIGEDASLAASLDEKRASLARLRAEYDAIALAMDALQSANTALQNRFSPALSRRTAELFSRLSGGKYDRVLLDRGFGAQAGERGEAVTHDAQLLSCGALDQLYLAVRLAICETVLPADDPPPVVLDDALVRFDDARCRAALELLLEESKTRQILLFTCQHRESAYLAGRAGVTTLALS